VLGKKYEYFEKCEPKEGLVYCEIGYRDPESGKIMAKKSGILIPQPAGPAKTRRNIEEGMEELLEKLRTRWEQIKKEGFTVERGGIEPEE